VEVELARQQWKDGTLRIEEERRSCRGRYGVLRQQVDVVVAGLRKRVGQTFTLAELANAYDGAEDWARDLLADAEPELPPALEPGTVADAAFHIYARGASDYRP
jgi:hypothetical protein